jgi:hypothetical protein
MIWVIRRDKLLWASVYNDLGGMSFILIPKTGEDIKINAWNWRPTVALLRHANLIDELQHELMGCNGCGGKLNSETAKKIADFLDQYLAQMTPGQRPRADLTVTGKSKKLAVFASDTKVEDIDAVELYSATYEWLLRFRDFCRTSVGFEVR